MFCPKCREQVAEGVSFCSKCGTMIKQEVKASGFTGSAAMLTLGTVQKKSGKKNLLLVSLMLAGVGIIVVGLILGSVLLYSSMSDVPYDYKIQNGKVIICGYKGDSLKNITIPKRIGIFPVTYIGNEAFKGCTGLTSINLPDSVESIGMVAFKGCTGLTSIKIPEGVKGIFVEAFAYCSGLESIEIPASVEDIQWIFGVFAPREISNLESIIVESGSYAEKWARENGYEEYIKLK